MEISEYQYIADKIKKVFGDKISAIAIEKSNYDCDLTLYVKIEDVLCPTCFQKTIWRSVLNLVDSTNNFDINKVSEEERLRRMAEYIEKIKIFLAKNNR